MDRLKILLGLIDGLCRMYFSDFKLAIQKKQGYYLIAIKIPISLTRKLLYPARKNNVKNSSD